MWPLEVATEHQNGHLGLNITLFAPNKNDLAIDMCTK